MKKSTHDSASSDEDDAPETFTMDQTKREAKRQEKVKLQAQIAVQTRKREKNRNRDKQIKAQAEGSKRVKRRNAVVLAVPSASENSEDEGDTGENAEGDGMDVDNGEELEGNEEGGEESAGASLKPDYLPDHLFEAAFKTQPQSKSKTDDLAVRPRKKRRPKPSAKDVLIGSRLVRALPSAHDIPSTKAINPSRKVRNFVERKLGLKGNKTSGGYQRRPANVGVLKSGGPPVSFVRRS